MGVSRQYVTSGSNTKGVHVFPGICVKWFQSRERALQWEEEVLWLEREAATVISDFEHRAKTCQSWNPAVEQDIPLAFARRQEAVWRSFHEDAANRLLPLLRVRMHSCLFAGVRLPLQSSKIPQCQAVLKQLLAHEAPANT